jgi:signal transduction histidine kinase
MVRPDTGEVFGFVHYQESPLVGQLRLMPILQIGIAGFLVVLGYLAIRSVRQSEKRSILVGMAKETAHQLGTPLSSLLGWVELLEEEAGPEDTARRETLREMRADISRLGQVARRFERIGSRTKLTPQAVNPVLSEVVEYLRRRLPSRGRTIEIVEHYNEVPAVETDPELLSWTVENLLRNAIDAIMRSGQGGHIEIRTSPGNPTGVRIVVEDDGPGIPDAIQGRIFDPGFTTKQRGWGLGLALARRIICEYHRGQIRLLRSTPGVRTVFVVDLPEKVPGRAR